MSSQPLLEQRQEAQPLGGRAGPTLGELLRPEQRARQWWWQRRRPRLHQEPRIGGAVCRAGEREGRGGERGGGAAEAGLDSLHACRELLLQRPHGPSGTLFSCVFNYQHARGKTSRPVVLEINCRAETFRGHILAPRHRVVYPSTMFPGRLHRGGHQQAAGPLRALRGGAGEEAGTSQGCPAQVGAPQDQTGRGPR